MTANSCVPEPELARFVLGDLDEEHLHRIAEHVDDCTPCQDTVVAIAEQSNTFVESLQAAAARPSVPQENGLQLGLKRMLASLRANSSAQNSVRPDDTDKQLGAQIGPYRIESQLGVGGMGNVYRATHTKLKRTVAVKVLPANRWSNTMAVSRFAREMEAIGGLDHPHIVRASDAGEDNGMHYLVMEYIDGLDLSQLVNRLGPLPFPVACELARQCAIGLHHAHESGLVHRDIKPSNLMLAWEKPSGLANSNNAPTLKILDLGLALLGDEHLQEGHEITTVGTLMGTLDYMSPEQGVDSHSVDQRTDIYSLGATLFKLLTGRAPYADPQFSTLMKKMTALATKAAPSIGSVRADLPDGLVTLVDQMLKRDPEDRFESAREVAEALAPFAAEEEMGKLLRRACDTPDPTDQITPRVPITALGNSTATVNSPENAHETASVSRRSGGYSRRWLIALAAAGLAIVGGVIFYLQTDHGVLTIRSDTPNAKILIKQADKTIKELRIENNEQEVRLRTGTYDLLVVGDAQVSIEPNYVGIYRGEQTSAILGKVSLTTGVRQKIQNLNAEASNLNQQNEPFSAIAKYNEAIEIGPNFDSLFAKGKLLQELGWTEEAIAALDACAQHTDHLAPAELRSFILRFGQAKLDAKQYQPAMNIFRQALDKPAMSLNADLWLNLGKARAQFAMNQQFATSQTREQDLRRALEAFSRALQLRPNDKESVAEKERIETLLNGSEEARMAAEKEHFRLAELDKRLASSLQTIRFPENPADRDAARASFAELTDPTEPMGAEFARIHTIQISERIFIKVAGTVPEQPIDGNFIVEPTGTVHLGALYGRVGLHGLTYQEAEVAIRLQLKEFLMRPDVMVTQPTSNNDRETADTYRGKDGGTTTGTSKKSAATGERAATFANHDFDYYLDQIKTDRSLLAQSQAIEALGMLGEDRSAEAARAILTAMRNASGIQVAEHVVIKGLVNLNEEEVADCIVQEITEGNARSRDLLFIVLSSLGSGIDLVREQASHQRLIAALENRGAALATAALSKASGSNELGSKEEWAWLLLDGYDVHPAEVDGMSEMLQTSFVQKKRYDMAASLIKHLPDTPGLAKAALTDLGGYDDNDVIRFASMLGPKRCLPFLDEITSHLMILEAADMKEQFPKFHPLIRAIGEMGDEAKSVLPALTKFARKLAKAPSAKASFDVVDQAVVSISSDHVAPRALKLIEQEQTALQQRLMVIGGYRPSDAKAGKLNKAELGRIESELHDLDSEKVFWRNSDSDAQRDETSVKQKH